MTPKPQETTFPGPITGRPVPLLSWAADRDSAFDRFAGGGIENLCGRRRHVPLYQDWAENTLPSAPDAFRRFLKRAGKNFEVVTGELPGPDLCDGPVLAIFNHPFGLWDGFNSAAVLEGMNRPFKFLAHEHYATGLPHLAPLILPISWDPGQAAARRNLASRDAAMAELRAGHVVGIYPAGHVAVAPRGFGHAVEQPWQPLVARLVMKSRCTVLPVFCEGQLSRTAQIARALHPALGDLTQLTDFYAGFGEDVRVHIGAPVPFDALTKKDDRKRLTQELRELTLDLGRRAGAYPHPRNA